MGWLCWVNPICGMPWHDPMFVILAAAFAAGVVALIWSIYPSTRNLKTPYFVSLFNLNWSGCRNHGVARGVDLNINRHRLAV